MDSCTHMSNHKHCDVESCVAILKLPNKEMICHKFPITKNIRFPQGSLISESVLAYKIENLGVWATVPRKDQRAYTV